MPAFQADRWPASPKSPLPGAQDVKCERQIRDGVRGNAGREAACAAGDEVEERAGEHGCGPVRPLVLEAEGEAADEEGTPREGAEWNVGKIVAHKETEQESAPENFFDEGDDDGHAEEPEGEIRPVRPPARCKKIRVKAVGARRKSEHSLGQNPDAEREEADERGKSEARERAKLDAFSQFPKQDCADESLER